MYMKKTLAFILALAMLIGICTAALAFDNTQTINSEPGNMVKTKVYKYFGDRSGLAENLNATAHAKNYGDLAGEYFYARKAVSAVAGTGIFKGHTDKKFHPAWYLTEKEMGLVAARLSEYITGVDAADKYAEMISAGAVKRQELVAVLYDALKSAGVEIEGVPTFGILKGSEAIKEENVKAYKALLAAGIVGADIRNNLRADEYINRADAAVMVYNVLQYIDMLPLKS